jgi:hypothetical protein
MVSCCKLHNRQSKYTTNILIMKSTNITRKILVISVLLFSIVTCKGQNDPSDGVVGIWTKTSDERTITLTITADHKYQVEFTGNADVDVLGSYVISGIQITFTDEGGEYSADEPGVYEFKLSDTSLSFTTVDDPSYGRSMLVEGSWSKEI